MFKKAINTHCHQACNSLWTVHFPVTEFTKKATLRNSYSIIHSGGSGIKMALIQKVEKLYHPW